MADDGSQLNPEQFLARRWSVITKTNMRYVGLMVDFNMEESTFRLQDGMLGVLWRLSRASDRSPP